MAPPETRSEVVRARITPEHKAELERIAARNGVALSVVVRWALEDWDQRVTPRGAAAGRV